jgi:hypothetical protein
MKLTGMIVAVLLLVLGFTQTARGASSSTDNRKTEDSKGVTVEDLGRGLKSAVQNIEKDPKSRQLKNRRSKIINNIASGHASYLLSIRVGQIVSPFCLECDAEGQS